MRKKKIKKKKTKNDIKPTLTQVQQEGYLYARVEIIHLDEQKAPKATQTVRELLANVGTTVDWGEEEEEEMGAAGGEVEERDGQQWVNE